MPKRIFYGSDARARVLAGAKKHYDAVKVTYGPRSGNVMIDRLYDIPTISHDGATVSENIELANIDDKTLGENAGSEMMKGGARKLNRTVADGRTSVTILSFKAFEGACKLADAGYNVQDVRKGMERAVEEVMAHIDPLVEQIKTPQRTAEVATISAGDEKIGQLIATVVKEIGKEGVISVESSRNSETTREVVEGYTYDRGFNSPFFVTDVNRQEAIYEGASVIITDQKITDPSKLLDVMKMILNNNRKGILLIADDVTGDALSWLVLNKMDQKMNIVVAKCPGFGDARIELLEDIAVLTGGKVINNFDIGHDISEIGMAKKVIISKDTTTIIGGMGDKKLVKGRIKSLKIRAEHDESEFLKEKLTKRAAAMNGKVAIIKVGGSSDQEIEELKFRVNDAVAATKLALANGIVAGGGITLVNLSDTIEHKNYGPITHVRAVLGSREAKRVLGFEKGRRAVKKALKQPLLQLMENSGLNGKEILRKINKAGKESHGMGIDLAGNTTELVNLVEAGVIDPVSVVKEVISSAISIASVGGTLGALIVEIPEKRRYEE